MRSFLAALLLGVTLAASAGAQTLPQTTPPVEQRAFPIFFTPWSALLDEAAEQGLVQVADLAKRYPGVPILVVGYADPHGSREANVLVSRLRATLVAEELVERGVHRDRIRVDWRGPTNPAFEALESRRVEVRVDTTR